MNLISNKLRSKDRANFLFYLIMIYRLHEIKHYK